ncbi:transposase [Clostridium weizhouense]|uniref:transposase n=1 Tax=Clostridium weizhouense TaxID=2859781 RepID=UPI0021565289|nr:transposase [Clostridium weizhouense]
MPTLKRIWYEGAMYHVTTRGNHKEIIFKEEEDFEKYLDLVEESLHYYNEDKYEIICYCLMTNHIHIMIRTGSRPLGDFIRRISSSYAMYFNKKYECTGHLFQGRYHSEIIKNDIQLLETSRYIHLNPVKAKIVNKPEDYSKSSYRFFIKSMDSEQFVKIKKYFENNNNKVEYKNFSNKDNYSGKLRLINPNFIWRYFNQENKYEIYKMFVESGIDKVCNNNFG